MKPAPLSKWLPHLKLPLVIAGPCSAESEEQVMATARELAKNDAIKIFRAGIWKPRTRPGSFEGVGEIGLPWLAKVKKELGLLTCCEVANAQHVELALKHGIDILWVGARTSANPFSVQEIAEAVRGVGAPIMVKNPVNADLSLWMGALERFDVVGVKKLVAIHRGFSTADKSKYRNQPKWRFPLELKSKVPDLPIICDPSHISGRRELIAEICQKAVDADMDGFMIETHIDPSMALSDASQQVTPKRLGEILEGLVQRTAMSIDRNFEQELETLRAQIDRIDHELIETLRMRMDIVDQIGVAKAKNNITALQATRMEELMNERMNNFEKLGMNREYAREIYNVIHAESVKKQSHIMQDLAGKPDNKEIEREENTDNNGEDDAHVH